MHNADIQSIVANQWVGMSYAVPLTLKGAITEPFRVLLRGESTFNPVWWVLRDMFFASLLVYAICCLRSMLSSRRSYSSIAADAACIALILFFIVIGRDIYFSVLIGAFYGTCEKAVGRARTIKTSGRTAFPFRVNRPQRNPQTSSAAVSPPASERA